MIAPSKAELRLLRALGFRKGRGGFSAERFVREHDKVWVQLTGAGADAPSRHWTARVIMSGRVSKPYINTTLGGALAMGELNGWA